MISFEEVMLLFFVALIAVISGGVIDRFIYNIFRRH